MIELIAEVSYVFFSFFFLSFFFVKHLVLAFVDLRGTITIQDLTATTLHLKVYCIRRITVVFIKHTLTTCQYPSCPIDKRGRHDTIPEISTFRGSASKIFAKLGLQSKCVSSKSVFRITEEV